MRSIRQRRLLVALATAVTMTLALGIPVAADLNLVAGDDANVAYTNGEGVNVRDYAGFTGNIIATLGDGEAVTITDGPMWLDDGTAWYAVAADTWNGTIYGWVIADYLSGSGVIDGGQGGTYTISTSGQVATVVGTDGYGLRLRDGASTDAGVISVMAEGSVVTILASEIYDGAGNAWAQVDASGTVGYAASGYLALGDSGSSGGGEPLPNTNGSLSPGSSAVVSYTGGGGLNMRSEAAYWASVLTVLAEGSVVSVLDGPYYDDQSNPWYQVDAYGTVGWAHGGYLAYSEQSPPSEPQAPVEAPPAETPDDGVSGEQPIAPSAGVGGLIANEGAAYVGTPYVWGGTTPTGWDCSGFTYYIVNKVAEIGLSRSLEIQAVTGYPVDYGSWQAGDLVFFQNTYKWGLSHVGISMGGDSFVHASSERVGTVISSMSDSYWGPRYYTARRVVD